MSSATERRVQTSDASDASGASATSTLRPWQPWSALALFGFLLNFVWEMLSVPFYSGMGERSHAVVVRSCVVASLGDVVITLLVYGIVSALRTRQWVMAPETSSRIGFIFAAVGITVLCEYVSVYRLARWSYAPAMPLLVGIGVVPIAQWVVLPLFTLWLTRRHLAGVISIHLPSAPIT